MADNIPLPNTLLVAASDEIAGVQYQRVKLTLGADGVNGGDVAAANPMPVSGTVTVSNPTAVGLTDTQLRATAVPVSGTVTANTGFDGTTARPLLVDSGGAALIKGAVSNGGSTNSVVQVSGSDGSVTRALATDATGKLNVNVVSAPTTAVTGPLTDTQLRASAVPVSLASVPSHAVTNAGTFSVQVTSAPSTPVTGTFWQTTQPVSIASMPSTPVTGTFWQTTQPVSIASMPSTPVTAASLPLPTGAATETTLSALNTKVTAVNTGAVTISSALPTGSNVIGIVRAAGQTLPGSSVSGLSPILAGGTDGSGNMQGISVDTSGKPNVNVSTSVLPTGASTEATLAALKAVQDTIQSQTEIIEYALMALLDKIAMPDRYDRTRVAIADNAGNEISGAYYGINVATVGDPNTGRLYSRFNEIWNSHDTGSTRIYNNITVT